MENNSQNKIPAPEGVGIPTLEKETPGHEKVQTYADDIAMAIEGDKEGGLIRKIIHESEEHDIEKVNLSPESKKNKIFIFASALLMLVSISALLFFIFANNNSAIPVAEQFVPIIFNDKSAFIEVKDLSKSDMVNTVLNEVNTTTVKKGGVEGIYLTADKKTIGLREFVSRISGNFSPGNADFVSDKFLMGVVNGETKDFFILIKMRSVPDVFDAMRAWEGKMFFDLQGFFEVDITPLTKSLLTKDFEDGIIENKNARILYDSDHKIAMMYVFADNTSVIIAKTETVARELMLRLAAGEIKK